MSTLLQLGRRHHGQELNLEDFMAAAYDSGFQYELIDGRLYVSPQADPPQNFVDEWIGLKLSLYSLQHPEIINFVSSKARVFIPRRRKVTNPEPDRACYRDFPKHLPLEEIRWQDLHPILVAEVLSLSDPFKDLDRNVKLYRRVPSIMEYWIFDTRGDPNEPTMLVHRRAGKKWKVLKIEYGNTYTTALLPGFALIVDPRG